MASASAEAIAEIMKAFEISPSEMKVYQDRVSGATVRQLTSYLGDSYHAYFTNNGYWDNDKRLLFASDRNNVSNLYSIELESGEISRLTDYKPGYRTYVNFINDVNPKRPEMYYMTENVMYAYDLLTLESRPLFKGPEGFNLESGLVGADGKYLYTTAIEDLSKRIYTNLSASYVGFEEFFRAKPDCRIIRVDLENGGGEVVWQDNCWIQHVNPSPTQPNMLTFCHEGPWDLVEQRMWTLDLNTGKVNALRPRRMGNEQIGHEYWYADGIKVGYQVHKPGIGTYFGVIDYDGSNEYEGLCVPFPSPDHIHSNDFNLIVSDAGNSIKLYRYNGVDFDEARTLCMHDGSFFHQNHHPHPRFSNDGKQILYNSNSTGYCNMYLVDIPEDVTALPKVKG